MRSPTPESASDAPDTAICSPRIAPNLRSGLEELAASLPTDLRTVADIDDYRRVGASRSESPDTVAETFGLDRDEKQIAGRNVTIFHDSGQAARAHAVFLHGGGLIAGDRFDGVDVIARHAKTLQCDVWTVGYPLAPEHQLDEMVDVVLRVIEICGNDGLPVVLVGQSGGAGLAAAAALAARDRGITVAGHLLICPMLDDLDTCSTKQFRDSPAWSAQSNQTAWAMAIADSGARPPGIRTDLHGLPPTFVDVGTAELFRDSAADFAMRLGAAGSSVELHMWSGAFHSSDCVVERATVSKQAHDARAGWLQRLLDGEV